MNLTLKTLIVWVRRCLTVSSMRRGPTPGCDWLTIDGHPNFQKKAMDKRAMLAILEIANHDNGGFE